MRRKNKSVYFIIILVVAFLGIGYAYLTTTLSINGVTDVDSNTWNIYWSNIQEENDAISEAEVLQDPTIDASGTTVSFHIRLREPGEHYSFLVDAVNDGTIDAMIDSISFKMNNVEVTTLPAYLTYSITYSSGEEVQEKQMIQAGRYERYKIYVKYRDDISASDLPSTPQSLNFSFSVNYVQADSNAVIVDHSIYVVSNIDAYIGSSLPSNIDIFMSPEDAMTDFGYPFFIRHIIQNGIITESYLGCEYHNQIYYLRGGGATFNTSTGKYNMDSVYYESNKQTLLGMFSSPPCEERTINGVTFYDCGSPYFGVANANGSVSMGYDNHNCMINSDGRSSCYFSSLG